MSSPDMSTPEGRSAHYKALIAGAKDGEEALGYAHEHVMAEVDALDPADPLTEVRVKWLTEQLLIVCADLASRNRAWDETERRKEQSPWS